MPRRREQLIGHLGGAGSANEKATVSVYKAGRDYRIVHQGKAHLCHPSVRSVTKLKAESFLVFGVSEAVFEQS